MRKGSGRDSSKKPGLCVRYCFDGAGEECRPGSDVPNDRDSDTHSPELKSCFEDETSALETKVTPSATLPNSWFQSSPGWDLNRPARLASARGRRQLNRPGGVKSSWLGDGDDDPGFFVTTKVTQPPTQDVLSWDSSPSSSSSEEEIKDIIIDGVVSGSNNNYLWGSSRTPVPPRARNLSDNRMTDDMHARASIYQGSHAATSKKMENTYRLDPKPGQTFVWYKAKRPIVNIVDQLLDEVIYNERSGPAVTRKLCDVIMRMIKKIFHLERYKFVCNVTLVQLKGQGVMIADRCLWNTTYDNVASYVYKNKFIVCVVTFHALYYE